MHMFTVALVIIASNWEQSKHSSIIEEKNKMQYTHTKELNIK